MPGIQALIARPTGGDTFEGRMVWAGGQPTIACKNLHTQLTRATRPLGLEEARTYYVDEHPGGFLSVAMEERHNICSCHTMQGTVRHPHHGRVFTHNDIAAIDYTYLLDEDGLALYRYGSGPLLKLRWDIRHPDWRRVEEVLSSSHARARREASQAKKEAGWAALGKQRAEEQQARRRQSK